MAVLSQATEVECIVRDKDTSVHQLHLDRERQHSELADGIAELSNSLGMHRVARKHFRDQVGVTLRELQERTESDILRERRGRQDLEVRLERAAESAAGEVRACLAEEAERQADSDRYAGQVRDEICHLYSDLEKARQLRIEAGQRLGDGVQVKLGEIREAVAAEHRFRMESQNTLLELFGQMGRTLDQELESARRERSGATDRLVGLMERVLPRMDDNWRKGLDACREGLEQHDQARDMADTARSKLSSSRRRSDVQMRRGSVTYRGSLGVV